MKRRYMFLVGLLILVVATGPMIACAGSPVSSYQKTETTLNITPQEAWRMIRENKGNPDFVLLDVRTPKEFFVGKIAGAINIDFYSMTFNQELGELDPTKTYLVYCKGGTRSAAAQRVMLKMGFKKVYNMEGGIDRWAKEGLPVVKGTP